VTRENAAAKGLRYLTEGRVVVEGAGRGFFSATVRGNGTLHEVSFGRGGWLCTCPARSACSHLRACWLIAAPESTRGIAA